MPFVRKPRRPRPWTHYVRHVVRLRDHPDAIARGVAAGMIVAFSPFFGFHIVLGLLLASLVRGSRLAVLPPLFLTNVFTAVPVYTFCYRVGAALIPGRPLNIRAVLQRPLASDSLGWRDRLHALMAQGWDLFGPLLLGGLIVGGLAAALSYPLTIRLVRRYRHRRSQRLRARRAHLEKHAAPPERGAAKRAAETRRTGDETVRPSAPASPGGAAGRES